MAADKILELRNITKLYPGVVALDNVSFSVNRGEVHAIMGENGAGKSTLIKIIGGAITATEGVVSIEGKDYKELTPSMAAGNGIGVIYQEFNLVPTMSVAENICLGDRSQNKYLRDKASMAKRADKVLKELGLNIDPWIMVNELSTGQQQMVEIAKQMIKNVKILIMDEPTASLSLAETNNLLNMVEVLKEKGVTILYISHRLEEIFRISDRISVFRDGKYIDTKETKSIDRGELIRMMVGRELGDEYPRRNSAVTEEVVLSVKDLTGQGDKNLNFELHRGEILGVAGLVGSGRTEMAKMIYGYLAKEKGTIEINGKQVEISKPSKAISVGLGLIPEDRKREGAFLDYSIDWNISIMAIRSLCKGIFVDRKAVDALAENYIKRFSIATPSSKQLVRNLSGGNQQKVVLAKTMATDVDILILDEPTRGIDVGAKREIYQLMNEFVQQGKSIIMISSEMEEVIGVSDRMLVFYEGEIAGELARAEFNQNKVMTLASGIKEGV